MRDNGIMVSGVSRRVCRDHHVNLFLNPANILTANTHAHVSKVTLYKSIFLCWYRRQFVSL